MRVIGSAGHVDHGKTALIRSMTGIDADRLPEEKARGMTTDLGFAWYAGGSGEPIGVVDVPGHERYLRNMVAGAWGLDLVVLVVAADDGWMPQTGLHASIVAAMAAPAVVIAVTKADAVTPGRVAAVTEDARDRAARLFGFRPEAFAVSNVTGSGIPELKAAIDRGLAALPGPGRSGAYLYVDRTFTPRGGGTVVTGTLTGGAVAVGDELTVWPRGERVRVRGAQSYRESVDRAEPNCRAALSVSSPKDALARGDLLAAPGTDILSGTEFLCRLSPLPGESGRAPTEARGKPSIRPGMEAEFALGSARRDVRLWPLGSTGFLRVTLKEPVACPAGACFVVLRRGGAELLGRGVAIRSGITTADDRKRLAVALPRAATAADALGHGAGDAATLRAAVEVFSRGWCPAPSGIDTGATSKAGFEVAGTVLYDPARFAAFRKVLAVRAAEPGGLSRAAAESAFAAAFPDRPVAADALDAAMASLEADRALVRDGPGWSAQGERRALTPEERSLLPRLAAAGKAGLEPGKDCPRTDARSLKALCSFGEAVPLDGGIFFGRAVYDACVGSILSGRKPGDRFSVPEAKERSGLSRKYILPLLNRMESRGLVRRSGDERVVLKIID